MLAAVLEELAGRQDGVVSRAQALAHGLSEVAIRERLRRGHWQPVLPEAFALRTRVRWRRELIAVVSDVADGCHSVLEISYVRTVERPHGLPAGRRQEATIRAGRKTYADVTYDGLVVELDGAVAHPEETRARDRRRDNAVVEAGGRTVRYGWADVLGTPCSVAAQVARLLQSAGWSGHPRRCGRPDCTIAETY